MAEERQFGQKPGPGSGLRCEDWEALLTDALDGLLPEGQAAAFGAHSESCANCGDLLAHAKQGQEWLGYLHTEPEIPSGLVSRILEKTVGAGGMPMPVVAAAGAGTGAVAMATPWRRSFHETRLLMTVAMAFFSIALTLNLAGVKLSSIRLADLRPSQLGSTLSREFFTARGSVVRYYDNLRLVYQLQSRMRELRRDVEQQPAQPQQNQKQEQKPGKGGSANKLGAGSRERGAEQSAELRAELGAGSRELGVKQRSALSAQRSEERKAAVVVLVSMGTGRWISLGHSETGLQSVVETAGYEGRSLV